MNVTMVRALPTLIAIVLCAVLTHGKAIAERPKYNCGAAEHLYRASQAALTAEDDDRALSLAQRAIEEYEMCKERQTPDDMEEEMSAEMEAAAIFQTRGDQSDAQGLYLSASSLLAVLCSEDDSQAPFRRMWVNQEIRQFRRFAEPLGLTLVPDCEERVPMATPNP